MRTTHVVNTLHVSSFACARPAMSTLNPYWPLCPLTLSCCRMSLGRLRVTALVRFAMCVHREGVPADVWCVICEVCRL